MNSNFSIRSQVTASAMLVVALLTFFACGSAPSCDEPCSTSPAVQPAAMLGCDPMLGCDEYPDGPGGTGTATVYIVTTNDDTSARTFDVSYVLKDTTGNVYRRVDVLVDRLIGPGQSVTTTATASVGSGFGIYTTGADAQWSAIWDRYDYSRASVTTGTYTCTMHFKMDGTGWYSSGCP